MTEKIFTIVRFLDTNVLLYAISSDPSEREKSDRARDILTDRDLCLSAQVLQEFYVQATRRSRPDPLRHGHAIGLVESFLRFPVQEIDVSIVLAACAARNAFGISYWDAAIIEAARAQGCSVVLSEGLSHGRDYAGILVENPFR